MAKVKDINKTVESMNKRLQKYASQFEGMFLNQNYYDLMRDVDAITSKINEGFEVKPQVVTGLIRRIKNVQKSRLTDMFDIYSPELDTTVNVTKSFKLPQVEFRIGEIVDIFKQKASDVIRRLRDKYRKPPTEDYEPPDEEDEIRYNDAVMNRIIEECLYENRVIWLDLLDLISNCIDDIGYDETAEWFELHAQDYGTSGELPYDDAKELYSTLLLWSYIHLDVEQNKKITNSIESSQDFGDL